MLEKELDPVLKSVGHVHTSYGLNFTTTGRLTSSDPNLQNVGKKSPVRKIYTSRFPGGKILQADYKQQEIRIIMYAAKAKKFIDTLEADPDYDPYLITANSQGRTREQAKALDLGLIYGKSEYGLVAEAGFTREQAQKFRSEWFKTYPEVSCYHGMLETEMRELGYIEGLGGRRRRRLTPENNHERNQLYNYPGQWGGAYVVFTAMLNLENALTAGGFHGIIVHSIHDSVVVDCPPEEVEQTVELMKRCMVELPEIPVKLAVEVTIKESL
jgi:DNA polymerase-1